MSIILLIISIICFILSAFFLFAKITGSQGGLTKILIRIVGLLGTFLPIVYWLKLLNVI